MFLLFASAEGDSYVKYRDMLAKKIMKQRISSKVKKNLLLTSETEVWIKVVIKGTIFIELY